MAATVPSRSNAPTQRTAATVCLLWKRALWLRVVRAAARSLTLCCGRRYVLFKKGLRPDTDFQTPDGEHATKFELRWRAARSTWPLSLGIARLCWHGRVCAACRLVFVCGWLGQAHYVVCHARVWHSKWR